MQKNKETPRSSVKNIRDEERGRRKRRTGSEVMKSGRRRLRERGIQEESNPERVSRGTRGRN